MAVLEAIRSAAVSVAASLPLGRKASSKKKPINQNMDPPVVHARFDAAQDTAEFANYWAAADTMDADAAHSRNVRQKLVARSRYEIGSNAYSDGMVQTHANYVVGTGPKLRMKTKSKRFNDMVEGEWNKWSKAVKLRRKLWTMIHAKMGDGESLGMVRTNPKIKHPVKLDVCLIETEQCQTPQLPYGVEGYIDGIRFDEYGNPVWYDVLSYHPGGSWQHVNPDPDMIPARFMLHWFALRRPGQHRGIPETKSSLNVGASSRRWREATVAAAETAADFSVLLQTQANPDVDPAVGAPFSSMDIQKRMIVQMPIGQEASQMKAEHPNATYEAFHRAQVSEQGRSKNMPHNLAAGDSSDHNFASGKLDFTPYYMQVDVERADGDDLVLDPLFELWFEEASARFGWVRIAGQTPEHSWDWPSHPVADESAKAEANEKRLKTGQASLPTIYAEDGKDFADELPKMADSYGVSEDEMKEILKNAIFNDRGALASMAQAANATASSRTETKTTTAPEEMANA